MGVWLRFVRYDANVVLRTEGLPRHRRTRHPPAGRETLVCIRRERVGFTKNTAMRHRRVGGRAVTVTAMLHRQKDREKKNMQIDI